MKQVSVQFFLTAFFIAFASSSANDKPTSSLANVPGNSSAFVHVKVRKLLATPSMVTLTNMFSQVKGEADGLFKHHFGVPISQLNDMTFVAPSFDLIQQSQQANSIPGFFLFTFTKDIDEKLISRRLLKHWQLEPADEGKLYVDKDALNAITICSPRTLAFGSPKCIEWLLRNKQSNSPNESLQAALRTANSSHVSFGIDCTSIPSELKSSLPEDLQCFAGATFATLNVHFDSGIGIRARIGFDEHSDPSTASNFIKQWIANGKTFLAGQEWTAKSEFAEQFEDFESALTPLATMGLLRFGQSILDEVELKQSNQTIDVACKIDGFDSNLVIVSSLSAIQAIGAAADARFSDIADDLASPTPDPSLSGLAAQQGNLGNEFVEDEAYGKEGQEYEEEDEEEYEDEEEFDDDEN